MLAHELMHVLQASHGRLDIAACVQLEVEAFRQQSSVWARIWHDGELPTRTQLEADLTTIAAIDAARGVAGPGEYVPAHPGYRHACRLDGQPADAGPARTALERSRERTAPRATGELLREVELVRD